MRLAAAVITLACQMPASAQTVQQACWGYADYALTATALARQVAAGRLERDAATIILAEMYDPDGALSAATAALLGRVRATADRATGTPMQHAGELLRRCVEAGADPGRWLPRES